MDVSAALREAILANLRTRQWRAGHRIPTERALAVQFGLSRSTVRRVLQQFKQQELLKPYYAKAKKAIEQVAKEKAYTHVLSSDIFLVAPEADDISLLVLAKLNIKLPTPTPKTPGKTGGN